MKPGPGFQLLQAFLKLTLARALPLSVNFGEKTTPQEQTGEPKYVHSLLKNQTG